jgi:membrane-associated phospholipid phosphatase
MVFRVKRGTAGMKVHVLACIVALGLSVPAQAGSSTETAGTAVAVALPLVAGGLTVYKHDWTGTAQLVASTVLTVGTVYALKHFIKECRPFAAPCTPGSNNRDSMPSDTSALAFAPAQFMWQRYGWEYGVPAYAAAGFVGWSRVDAKKHHWYDVAASFGVSLLYNEVLTTRLQRNTGFYSDLDASPQGVHAAISYRW